MTKKTVNLWWKLKEGKYVAHETESRLDGTTRALVRDLITSEGISRALQGRSGNVAAAIRIAETPLPFEPIQEWLTWTMAGKGTPH